MIVTNNSNKTYAIEQSSISPTSVKLIPDLFFNDLNGLDGIVITGYPSTNETYATSELLSLAIRQRQYAVEALFKLDKNGNQTGLIDPKDGSTINIGTPRNFISYRVANSVVEKIYSPKPSRVTEKNGGKLYSFYVNTPAITGVGTATTSKTNLYWFNVTNTSQTSNADLTSRIDVTGAGNFTATYTTSGLPAYDSSKGYVLQIYNGALNPVTSGFSISISASAGRSQSWTASGTAFKPGWNSIYLCSPVDTVARGTSTPTGYGDQSGVVQVGSSGAGGMNGVSPTSVSLTFFNAQVGDIFCISSIFKASKVKPVVAISFDQAPTDISTWTGAVNPFLNEVLPLFSARGLSATARFHALADLSPVGLASVNAAVAAGWSVVNGSLTRLTPCNTVANTLREHGQNLSLMSENGFENCGWARFPGNNTQTDTEQLKSTLLSLGIEFAQGNGQLSIYGGPEGYGNQYTFGSVGFETLTGQQAINYIEAAKACGTHINMFSHYPKAPQTQAELVIFLDYLAQQKSLGLIDVFNLKDFSRALKGEI